MEHSFSQRKACAAIALSFDQFQLGDVALDQVSPALTASLSFSIPPQTNAIALSLLPPSAKFYD
jgi:hypothetical protein